MNNPVIQIGQSQLSLQNKPYIVAELSANHGNNLETALKTVSAAKYAGADAIKLQTYTADSITLNHKSEIFKINQGTTWDGEYLYDLYEKAHMPWEWHESIFNLAKDLDLDCFSSPFSLEAVDYLKKFNPPAFKIASFEITDIPLIKYTAKQQKPIIISTGIANEADIKLAIDTCHQAGNLDVILLKCTSAYPAPMDSLQLRLIPVMRNQFNTLVGLSDHSQGIIAPIIATSFNAVFIEKHFILDKSIGGPDAHFSLEPKEFKEMVNAVHQTFEALGTELNRFPSNQTKSQFARSLFIVKDVKKGDFISEENVRSIRPSHGLHPKYYESILGKLFSQDLPAGTPLSEEHYSNS
jgi:pseudaminic acid synthase